MPPLDPQALLQATEGIRSDRKLKTGEVVLGQGDPSDAIFHVRAGRTQLTVVSDQGKEGVIALFGPGDSFGEGSRVNYFMNKFRKLGLIEYNGTIKVHTALISIIVHD